MSENQTQERSYVKELKRITKAALESNESWRKRAKMIGAAMVLSVAGLGGYEVYSHTGNHAEQIMPAQLAGKQGKLVTMSMTVEGGRKFDRRVLLNSHRNFRDPSNTTIVIPATNPLYATIDPQALRGRQIEVTGTASEYQGRPQVIAEKLVVK